MVYVALPENKVVQTIEHYVAYSLLQLYNPYGKKELRFLFKFALPSKKISALFPWIVHLKKAGSAKTL